MIRDVNIYLWMHIVWYLCLLHWINIEFVPIHIRADIHLASMNFEVFTCLYRYPWIFVFTKNKKIFIHSNRYSTSFNTAKNVKDESANNLTTSKLITYNDIIPTKTYNKIKVTGILMPPDLQCWRLNLWLNNRSLNMNQMNTATR